MATKNWSAPNVGATGRRRIVPMTGVGFIAGQIQSKTIPYTGKRPASMGGRTRYWSTINFLNINLQPGRHTPWTASELARQDYFKVVSQRVAAMYKNPADVQKMLTSYQNSLTLPSAYEGVYAADCLNVYSWAWQVIYARAGGDTSQVPEHWPYDN